MSRDLSDDNDSVSPLAPSSFSIPLQVDVILLVRVGIGADDDSADSLYTPHDSEHCGHSPCPFFFDQHFPAQCPKSPHPLLPDESRWQEVDVRVSVTFAKELAGMLMNILGTLRRENVSLIVAQACHFNFPFEDLLNCVMFSCNAVQTGLRQ
ncbi:hypothetical protein BLNAU_13123 [Blattamonas nauphoetae]|uniref:Uncharacterized protein n=1 Tax=Blattamonas nauphoetae TaxID=2049346 RepID=A0ABQ9XKH2_9EUKA|nr:hypothetical protein BLNAU_13123 [Blattamonas nauphoetae]